MITVKNLTKIYRTKEIETAALRDVNIEIKKGEFVSIMGPSGCGKSTLLNLLGMLDNPSDGQYIFCNQEVSNYSERQRTNLRKINIGFIFQSFNLLDDLTVYKNIELPLIYLGIDGRKRKQRVTEVLEQLDISARKNHYPRQLSGGQQQRVAVARAVIANPKMILADEPTGNLDSKNGDTVMEMLSDLNKQGTTIIMVTHSQTHAEYGHRTIYLHDGKIVTENVEHGFDSMEIQKKIF